jgi:Spy/CpxP family protein refolding chaperone
MSACHRLIVGALLAAGLAGFGLAQETKKDAPKATSKASASGTDADEKGGFRLPNNYGKLELTDKQKGEIQAIQGRFNPRIDALLKQIDELRDQRDAEIEAVLTASQKTKLKSLQDETAKKAAAKKKAKSASE